MEQVKKHQSAYVIPGTRRNPISKEHVNRLIQARGTKLLLTSLMNIVCKELGVSSREVFSKSRNPDFVFARHLLRYYGWELMGHVIPLSEVALFITNGRQNDHASVIRSKRLVLNSLDGKDDWSKKVLQTLYKIDEQLNQLKTDESHSTDRKSG